jgi:hypothetical protein
VKNLHLIFALALLAACASRPVNIGGNTYMATKTNGALAFGNADTTARDLIVQGNEFCAKQGREFQLVTQNLQPGQPGRSIARADITYKCVDQSHDVQMRPDRGTAELVVR